jgi:predicted nucleotidyltransferase
MSLNENSKSYFGLKPEVINNINTVFSRHLTIEKAILYGSRAKGNYRRGSDIDLTLVGDGLTYNLLVKVATEIDDLLLPYKVDLSIYQHISNADLIAHIERVGQPIYCRETF